MIENYAMIMESREYVSDWESFDFVLFRDETELFGLFGANNERKGLYKILLTESRLEFSVCEFRKHVWIVFEDKM